MKNVQLSVHYIPLNKNASSKTRVDEQVLFYRGHIRYSKVLHGEVAIPLWKHEKIAPLPAVSIVPLPLYMKTNLSLTNLMKSSQTGASLRFSKLTPN